MRAPPTLFLLLSACVSSEPLPFGSTSEECGVCHTAHYAEWEQSAHALGARSPVFVALLPRVEEAWGGLARRTCEQCHAPGHGGEAAVGCVACHGAVGNHANEDGLLAVDLDEPLAGPLGGVGVETEAHLSAPRAFLESSVLCGTCHEVTGPELLVEHTLGEFEASANAARGEECQDCHTEPVADRPLTDDTPARPSRDHRFIGFDPPWEGDVADPGAAEATRVLLAKALSLRCDGGAVVVENTGAGHNVPTGVSFLRELWVEVSVDRVAWPASIRIGDQPTRGGLPVALLTDADAVRAGSLAPGDAVRLDVPVSGRIEARLFGRAVRTDVLETLGLQVSIPSHLVAACVSEG